MVSLLMVVATLLVCDLAVSLEGQSRLRGGKALKLELGLDSHGGVLQVEKGKSGTRAGKEFMQRSEVPTKCHRLSGGQSVGKGREVAEGLGEAGMEWC